MNRRRAGLGLLAVAAVLLAACSSSGGDDDAASTTEGGGDPTTAAPAFAFDPTTVGEVTVDGPITGGAGEAVLAQGAPDLEALGYAEEEFFVSGTASSFTSAEPLTSDGHWTVEPDAAEDFTTRILVRRPADAADFNGTVFVEWLNVTGGLDAAALWTQAQVELLRSGATWVGVSAQTAGISGEGGLGSALRLQNADPVRYEPLHHPGDNFSYDLFSQAGAAVRTHADTVMGGLEPTHVIAMGESQSAFRLSTYVNAMAPISRVFDGYLILSRSAKGSDLAEAPLTPVAAPTPTLVRDDLDVPVLVVTSETDLAGGGIGYAEARQPDTDTFRDWEVAGTAHYDAYGLVVGPSDDGSGPTDAAYFDAMSDPPSAIYGNIISCDRPFNAGPLTYVLRSAVAALDAWARAGEPPPEMPQLELDGAGEQAVDGDGIALGGMRTPQVDVPVATLSGSGQPPNGFCGLFGTTVPFDAAALADRYPDHDTFVEAWNASVDEAVESGVFLEADADNLKAAAAQSSIGGA